VNPKDKRNSIAASQWVMLFCAATRLCCLPRCVFFPLSVSTKLCVHSQAPFPYGAIPTDDSAPPSCRRHAAEKPVHQHGRDLIPNCRRARKLDPTIVSAGIKLRLNSIFFHERPKFDRKTIGRRNVIEGSVLIEIIAKTPCHDRE
jgi:hypothetical protein